MSNNDIDNDNDDNIVISIIDSIATSLLLTLYY